ncbi:MAG: bifunctional riboflavin kinase/FAD synthetase [Ferruginibacter sp.]
MNVYKDITKLPAFKNAVITIGTFDGVHQGHLQIIKQLVEEARKVEGTPVVITFYPHPKQVVETGRKPIFILNTLEEKTRLLAQAGIEHLVVVPFSQEFAEQPAADYVKNFLVNNFHPHTIIIGYDHRFGRNREGDYHLLEALADELQYQVKEIPEHVLRDITISSTRIREALLEGNVQKANEFLGYRYFFTGLVTEGNKLGRTIGYPTANLQIQDDQKLVAGNGVYAVQVVVENMAGVFGGMMNIGTRPTVDGTKRAIEVNIFAFDEMIYNRLVTVTMLARLRDEVKFNGLDALKAQLAKDKLDTMKVLDAFEII